METKFEYSEPIFNVVNTSTQDVITTSGFETLAATFTDFVADSVELNF